MTLRMASPNLNRLGIYTCRLWVPVDLQKILGKKEVVKSLGTRDPALAKRLFSQVVADFESQWQTTREAAMLVGEREPSAPEPRDISQREAHALAGEFYRSLLAQHGDNPNEAEDWIRALRAVQRCIPEDERRPGAQPVFVDRFAFHPVQNAFHAYASEVHKFLRSRNDVLETKSFLRLCSAVALAKRDAFEHLLRNAKGDYSPDPKAGRFPPVPIVDRSSTSAAVVVNPGAIGVEDLLEKWRTLSFPNANTYRSWAGKLRMLMRYVQKDDVAQLTTLDVRVWRDHRIAIGRDPGTVSAGDLSGVRNILAWAVSHTSVPAITENVAAGVTQKVPKKKRKLRQQGFTYEEAIKILTATLIPASDNFTEGRAGARRWVPWLCAYSGARVGEIGQMHSCRIRQEKVPTGAAYWCMEITPLDGTVKDSEARIVPIHSHLIEQGFLDYAARRQELGKPLFYEPELGRGSGSHRQSVKVGDRIREIVRDELGIHGVQPNHAWRHRFETMSRNMDIREDIIDHLTGHEGDDVSSKYGDFLVEALSNAVEKMPRYDVEAPNSIGARSRKRPGTGDGPTARQPRT